MFDRHSVRDRYTFGNIGITGEHEIYNEITRNGPNRQQALISLQQKHLDALKHVSDEFRHSNTEEAQMVIGEIAELERRLSDAIEIATSAAADQISESVFHLGRVLGTELSEIKWVLKQQSRLQEGILKALMLRRKTEARELVDQGIRHYVNGEYDEAKARFLRALDCDTTDYQVLKNLAYVSLNKDQPEEALKYFNKALVLPPPEDFDPTSKSDTLWEIARLHYATGHYQSALEFAKRSLELDSQPAAEKIFSTGVYACLASDRTQALIYVEQAIRTSPPLFVRTATDGDLKSCRSQMFTLLSKLYMEITDRIVEFDKQIQSLRIQVSTNAENSEYMSFLRLVRERHSTLQARKGKASYSDSVKIAHQMSELAGVLRKATQVIPYIDLQLRETQTLLAAKLEMQKRLDTHVKNTSLLRSQFPRRSAQQLRQAYEGLLGLASFLIGYFLPGIFTVISANRFLRPDQFSLIGTIVEAVLWPLLFLGGALAAANGSNEGAIAGASIRGLLFGLLSIAVLWITWKSALQLREDRITSLNKRVTEENNLATSVGQSLKEIGSRITQDRDAVNKALEELKLE